MNIQSLSVCVPAKKCINDCRFCCSKMHTADYNDCFSDVSKYSYYSDDMRKRLEYATSNGCNTCMLTGNNEPQQNKEFLRVFSEINKTLRKPFYNIEMQTSGAYIDEEMLDFFRNSVGLTTIAVSVACLDNDELNRDMIRTKDEKLNIKKLCVEAKKRNINLRICLNMNDNILGNHPLTPSAITDICTDLGADQITFRALWAPDSESDQGRWIKENVTEKTHSFIRELRCDIKEKGKYLDTLEYGADRYDYKGFSVVIDDDSMAQAENKTAIKYLILRPDGHLYSKWDSKASLIF